MKTRTFIITIAASLFIVACNSSSKKSNESQSQLKEFTEKISEIVPSVAQPSQAADLFKLAGVDFDESLILDPLEWKKYSVDSIICAANIGIYMTDAIYQYSTSQKIGLFRSIAAAKSLAGTVGMSKEFDRLIIDRYEDGTISGDSIIRVIDHAFQASNVKAAETDKMRFFLALVIGNYIQKQYIILSSIIDNPDELPNEIRLQKSREMTMMLKHQLEILAQLKGLAEVVKREEEPGILIGKLDELNTVYSSMDFSVEKINTITADEFFENPKLHETYRIIKEIRDFLTLK